MLGSGGTWIKTGSLVGYVPSPGIIAEGDTFQDAIEKLDGNVGSLSNEVIRTTRFESISTNTGTATLPTGSTVVLDDFGGGIDAVITTISGGRPTFENAYSAAGAIITSTFDATGNYVLSAVPSAYPVAIIYRVRQALSDYNGADASIVGEFDVESIVTSGAVVSGNTPEFDGATGSKIKDSGINLGAISDATREPTGFSVPESVVLNYDKTTQKVTITGSVVAYFRGKLVPTMVSGFVSDAHENTYDKTYFLYYDGTNYLWEQSVFPGFDNLLIAMVVYRAAANAFGVRECHGLQQWQSHRTDHYNIGTYRAAGGDISGITLSSTTAALRRPDISACTIYDEDLQTINAALTTKLYQQRYMTLASTFNFYVDQADIIPLSTNNPYYNQWNGSAWVQTLMPANSITTVWLYEVPVTADAESQKYRHVFVQGQSITQAANSSAGALATARTTEEAKSTLDLELGIPSVMSAEYVCISKFIIQFTGGNWTIEKIVTITGSKANQVGSPTGAYLTSVTSNATQFTGVGTPASPLTLTGKIFPSADSTTAVQVLKADGTTPIITVDTTNSILKIDGSTYLQDISADGANFASLSNNSYWASGAWFVPSVGKFSSVIQASNSGNIDFAISSAAGSAPSIRMRLNSSGNLGIGILSPAAPLHVSGDYTGASRGVIFQNTSIATTSLFASSVICNDVTTSIQAASSTYTGIPYMAAKGTLVTNGVNGLNITSNYNSIRFLTGLGTNNPAATYERMTITNDGSVVAGAQVALATTATDGFLYIPSCAGTPTGTPTAYTGKVAIVFDTTNNKLYAYDGSWLDIT